MNTELALIRTIKTEINIRQADINGYRINYAEAGAGKPVLLIHGGNIGWGQWYPNIAPLAKHFKVFAIDLPGGGRSTRIDYAKLDLERDLVAVVDEFVRRTVPQGVSLVGSSAGGWIAAKLAARGQRKIDKLILADAVGFSDHFNFFDNLIGFYPLAKVIAQTVFRPVRSNKNVEKLLRGVFYNNNAWIAPEFVDYFYETMSTSHNLLYISRLTERRTKEVMLLKDDLPKIKNPTLILWGASDPLMPLKKHSSAFGLIPGARIALIGDAGHIPSIEKPAEFNEAVINFLNGIS